MSKTVLVTGTSGDIGYAITKKYIESGCHVIGICNSNKEKIIQMQDEFANHFHSLQYDLSIFNNASLLLEEIHSLGFTVDILVNNAGISVVGVLQDLTANDWDKLWNTNVTSAIALSRSVLSDFLSKGEGQIINISSIWGNVGASCEAAYSATKGALNAFTKALAKELAPSNIRVNALACGLIDTKMNAHLSASEMDEIISEIPLGRIGTPEDVADAVYALTTFGTYITGQIITVDGGLTI